VTLGDAIAAATNRLAAAGVGSPRVDAELLAAEIWGDRSMLLVRAGQEITTEDAAAFDAMVARRAAREPLQHIVRHAPFRHLVLDVGPGVFIPRPETELLVDAVLPSIDRDSVVVDLCSGSGALAAAIAVEAAPARVIAVEADPAARVWLAHNARGVEVVAGDARDPELLRGTVADVVVCNPPYVPEGTPVGPEVLADPHDAVFAGPDGLALMPHVIARAADWLRPGGVLAVEHDDTHGESVPALLGADGRWRDIADHPDLSGRPRFATAIRR
jgi:release factor glutamine methyltransferase